jgi:hypothetical protein
LQERHFAIKAFNMFLTGMVIILCLPILLLTLVLGPVFLLLAAIPMVGLIAHVTIVTVVLALWYSATTPQNNSLLERLNEYEAANEDTSSKIIWTTPQSQDTTKVSSKCLIGSTEHRKGPLAGSSGWYKMQYMTLG